MARCIQHNLRIHFALAPFLIVLTVVCAATGAAQTYSINGPALGGGGGSSAGGAYSVSGTIGQPSAGTVAAGNYTVSGGFWALIGSVPTPGAPLVNITMTSTNTVLISWPSSSTGFILQQSLGRIGNWVDLQQAPIDNGMTQSILITPPPGNLFFRLKK